MAGSERLYLYWDPAIDGAFRRRLEHALGMLRVDTADGDVVDPDPDNPGVVMALASATDGWARPARADMIVQAGPGDFPASASALRLETDDIEADGPRWRRFVEKLRGALGMESLALPPEDLAVKLDETARRAEEAERTRDTAQVNESNAIRDRRQMELALADARKRIAELETAHAQLQTITEAGAYGLGLVPADVRDTVIAAREHAWRAQAAAARASEAAGAHPDVIAWGSSASYSGDVRNGKPDGFGVMLFRRGADVEGWYRGAFANGVRTGHGMGMAEGGLVWSGEWKADEACGLGVLEAHDGRRYEGAVEPDAEGAPKPGIGWTWRAPAEAGSPATHHPVNRLIAAPKTERLPKG